MEDKKIRVKVVFRKSGKMVYFSQLDMVKILERALRRTNLPLYFTHGFNPHLKMSLSPALKLGVEGNVEVTFYFTKEVSFKELKEEVTPQLPEGLEILNS